MNIIRCSFDFDGTLSETHVQDYAQELIERGIEVWIVTSRFENAEKYKDFFGTPTLDYSHSDLLEVADRIGISKENIHFTNMVEKSEFLTGKGFVFHLDDDYLQHRPIMMNAKIPSINVKKGSWKNKCERYLKKLDSL